MSDAFFSSAEMRVVRAPLLTIPACDACGLYKTCRSPKMRPDGRGRSRIMIVAEAPGKDEDDVGRPLVGRTGQELERVLAELGVDMRKDCLLTNAVICRPPDNDLSDSKAAVVHCRPNLVRTIREFDPEVIIPLGGISVRSLIGHLWKDEDVGGIGRWAGFRIPNHKPNAWVCPTYHPSYLLRQKDQVLNAEFKMHLRAAVNLPGRPWPNGAPDYLSQVEPILNPDVAAKRLSRYRDGLVAFDFEHSPLKPDPEYADLVCCSVCWNGLETIAFPYHGKVKQALVDLIEDPNVGKIASNMCNEDRWVRRRLGTKVANWAWDTMLAAHAIDSRTGITGLKFQAFVMLGQPDYSSHLEDFLRPKRDKGGGNCPNRIREVGITTLLKYCGLDSLLEYHLAILQMKEIGHEASVRQE